MRRWIPLLGLIVFAILLIGCATSRLERNANQVAAARQAVNTIKDKLAGIKGYSAEMEIQSLDPNGGFDNFHDEQIVSLPDKMLVKRKVLVTHNRDAVGQDITIVIDGAWSIVRTDKTHTSPPGETSYSKTNLKELAKAGGPSAPEYLSLMGNLVDAFYSFRPDTLKLEKETRSEWVFLAEFKQEDAPWAWNRVTIDKKTAFLKKIEAIIPQLSRPIVILKVKSVVPMDQFPDSLFKLDIPPPDSHGVPCVFDNTYMWIDGIKEQEERSREKKSSESHPK